MFGELLVPILLALKIFFYIMCVLVPATLFSFFYVVSKVISEEKKIDGTLFLVFGFSALLSIFFVIVTGVMIRFSITGLTSI